MEDGDKGGAAAIRGGGSSEEVSSIFFLAFFQSFRSGYFFWRFWLEEEGGLGSIYSGGKLF